MTILTKPAKACEKHSSNHLSNSAELAAITTSSDFIPFCRKPRLITEPITLRPKARPFLLWVIREAELIHGRIAQVAVVGFLAPGLFGTLPGNEWTGVDAYSNLNPLEAFSQVPGLAILQIFLFMTYLEIRRINIIKEEGADYQAGDLRIGQGEGRWNPFGLEYSEEAYAEKQLQELKHCRLAMIGVFGLWAQAQASGVGVTEQIGAALTAPDYYAKAGYFLPEGI